MFQGGSALEAIEAVCDKGVGVSTSTADSRAVSPLQIDVLDGLASLLNKSLIALGRAPRRTGRGETRFGMLETLQGICSRAAV